MSLCIRNPRRVREIVRLQRLVHQALDNCRVDVARVRAEAREKVAEAHRERDRARCRVLALETETARQHRLIETLQRDLLVARGMPAVQDKLGGAA